MSGSTRTIHFSADDKVEQVAGAIKLAFGLHFDRRETVINIVCQNTVLSFREYDMRAADTPLWECAAMSYVLGPQDTKAFDERMLRTLDHDWLIEYQRDLHGWSADVPEDDNQLYDALRECEMYGPYN